MFEYEVKIALGIAEQAMAVCADFELQNHHIEFKQEDQTPVTELDKKLNILINNLIAKYFPADALLGEETGFQPGTNDRVWMVDPLDGTKDFIKGTGEWAIQIGLCQGGEPIVGVVAWPEKKLIFYASKGAGCFIKNEKGNIEILKVRPNNSTQAIRMLVSRSRKEPIVEKFMSGRDNVKTTQMGSIGVKVANICLGNADVYLNASGLCSLWDTCAPELILREAGGRFCDFNGSSIHYDAILSKGGNFKLVAPFVAVAGSFSNEILSWAKSQEEQCL